MAKIEILKMPDEFLLKLSTLGSRIDEVAPRILEAGARPVLRRMKANLAGVIGKSTKYPSKSKGELIESLGITKARQDRNGNWNIKVGIGDSMDSSGVANALKGLVIEYGKHGQPPKPWLKPARIAAKPESMRAMQEELEKELGKI